MSKDNQEFLDDDNEIPGQRFTLLSFLSPENVLDRKEHYFFEQFLKHYEVQWKTKNLEKFLAKQVMDFNAKLDSEVNRLMEADQGEAAEICRAARIPVDTVLGAYQEYIKDNAKDIKQTKIKEDYDDFMFANGKKLEDEFFTKNNFQTSVRGLKVRGSYPTQEEANARAKKLQRNDPIHNIYVAEVGKWLAWDPKPHEVAEQEYANDQLNSLMKSYKENEEQREEFFKQNPDAKKGGKAGFRSEKEIMSIVGTEEDKAAAAAGGAVSGGEHDAMFNGGIDLALQRKMERDAAKKDSESKE
jgi:hypothetical protein